MSSQALVEWWDGSSMYVRCPGCDKIHKHGFDGNYETQHRLASHCDSSKYHCDTYDIRFPLQFEIDKERVLFVAAGSDPTEYFSKNAIVRAPLPKGSSVRKWEEATEKVYAGEEEIGKRIEWVASEMVMGNVEYVRDYIKSSSELDIFLHGIDAYDINGGIEDNDSTDLDDAEKGDLEGGTGNTALHLAACESYPEMIQVLLRNGANPNVLNFEGRTPLAETALWGRLQNVKILLENGANKRLECFRSGHCLQAIDFAKPTDANDEERHSRSRGCYKEDAYQKKLDRRAIVGLLEDDIRTLDTQNHTVSGFAFTKAPGQETRLTLLAHFDVPNVWKTIAVLYRGDRFTPITATSGWGHQADDQVNVQIAGRDWTSNALRLCEIVGYDLVLDDCDQGVPGRYHACHAEIQLVAYFINKHCFLRSKSATHAGPDDVSGEELGNSFLHMLSLEEDWDERSCRQAYAPKQSHNERLRELHSRAPPFGLKTATIVVSRPVCDVCERFVNHINHLAGLEIKAISHSSWY